MAGAGVSEGGTYTVEWGLGGRLLRDLCWFLYNVQSGAGGCLRMLALLIWREASPLGLPLLKGDAKRNY